MKDIVFTGAEIRNATEEQLRAKLKKAAQDATKRTKKKAPKRRRKED